MRPASAIAASAANLPPGPRSPAFGRFGHARLYASSVRFFAVHARAQRLVVRPCHPALPYRRLFLIFPRRGRGFLPSGCLASFVRVRRRLDDRGRRRDRDRRPTGAPPAGQVARLGADDATGRRDVLGDQDGKVRARDGEREKVFGLGFPQSNACGVSSCRVQDGRGRETDLVEVLLAADLPQTVVFLDQRQHDRQVHVHMPPGREERRKDLLPRSVQSVTCRLRKCQEEGGLGSRRGRDGPSSARSGARPNAHPVRSWATTVLTR